MLEEARSHALDRLVHNAAQMGANAVLMMRFDSAEIGNTMSEIVAYGTAAKERLTSSGTVIFGKASERNRIGC